jgi:hypothetical protein
LLSCVAVAGGVAAEADADAASLREMLAAALEANERLSALAEELREDNERLRADLAVLQRMLFGRSSERARPEPPPAGGGGDAGQGGAQARAGRGGRGRGRGGGITRTCPGLR